MNALQDVLSQRILTGVGIVVFALIAAISIRLSQSYADDFHAFYCGGAVASIGADPYRVEPLRTCEHRGGSVRAPWLQEGAVTPVPLPGYDLAMFALLARLPYSDASLIWQTLLWISVAATVACMRSLTKIPLVVIIAVFLFSDGYVSSIIGQMVPVSLAGIALGAWAISRGRYMLAVLGVLISLCEPHIAAASCLALVFFSPPARPLMVACAGVIAFFAYETRNALHTAEYFHDILPGIAFSEIAHNRQYSLTSILHFMGASDSAAIIGEMFSQAALLVAGLIVAQRLRRSLREEAFLMVIPAAFSLLGGVYVHLAQTVIALPAGLLLYASSQHKSNTLRWGIVLLAVPWALASDLDVVEMFVVFSIVISSLYFFEKKVPATKAALVQIAAFLGGAWALRVENVFGAEHASRAEDIWNHLTISANGISTDAWRFYVAEAFAKNTIWSFLFKVPTWIGLAAIVLYASFGDKTLSGLPAREDSKA